MRKLMTLAVMVAALACGACCGVEKQAVENLGRTQDIINAELLRYVDNDPKLADEAGKKKRQDWRDLVRSENDLRAGLLKK